MFETKSDAASAAGVTTEQFNKWIKGTVKVPAEALLSITKHVDVDFSWLVVGDQRDPIGRPDRSGLVPLPMFSDVRPSAGLGALALDEIVTTRVAVEERWLSEIGVAADSSVILPAQGDSMEPTIRDGSPMLVDTSKKEIRNGFIYVFNVDDDLIVKRIARLPDGSYDLISDNTNYPTRNLAKATVMSMTVIGRVYAAVSRF